VPHVQKPRGSKKLTNFIKLFHEFIVFFSCHFVLHSSLITSCLCYGKMRELQA
jgi:hypothetical protein